MDQYNKLAEKVFALLKGNGLKIKIFDHNGAETTDPSAGRRFFVVKPNIMVTIEEDGNKIEFSKGSDVGDSILSLQKNIRKLADEFMINSSIKVFGRSIQPRDYAYQAKLNKEATVMENNMIKPVNHHLLGQIMKMIKYFGGKISEAELTSNLGIFDLSEIRPVLNRLVQEGKLNVEMGKHNTPVYSISIEETVMESFSKMFGSLKTSRQVLENVRILVRHKVAIDENVRGARSRHISAVFLECNGERFKFPYNHLQGARAMAQHMTHGGTMSDKVGSYITESVGQILKLQSFNRYVSVNKLINEDSSSIVETIKENIQTLRTELKKFIGKKTYETIRARIETFDREVLSEDDVSQLKDLFTVRRFDEKFEEVLPIVKQLVQEKDTYHKRIEESANNVIRIRSESISTTPMFEFASENSRLGFKLNELALRIMENEELAGFVNKIGTKICKEGKVNDFEKAVLSSVFENLVIDKEPISGKKDITESIDFETFFNRYDYKFI
jgi:uncharacterized protein YkvS